MIFPSLKSRASLIILVASLPLLLLVADGYRRERDAAIAAIEQDIRIALHVVLREETQVVAAMRTTLGIMSRANDMHEPTAESCSGLAQRMMQSQVRYANLGAAWPDGQLFCSAKPFAGKISVADRAWFKEVAATRQPGKGHYAVGRVSGESTVVYGFPQLDANGHLRTALFASLPFNWFDQILENVPVPAGWHATVISPAGQVAAEVFPGGTRHAHVPDDIRQLLGEPPAVPRFVRIDLPTGAYLVGAAPLSSVDGLYVLIGADAEEATAPIQQRLLRNLLLVLAVTLASLAVAWRLIRRSILDWATRMGEVVRSFGTGRLDTRAGRIGDVAELQTLTDSFDAMAERLARNNEELEARVRERTAALERSNAELEAFAYSVSHDLRAPLRAVIGFGDILAEHERGQFDSTATRYLDHIRSAARRMDEQIEALLQYARIGRGMLRHAAVDLAPLLREIVADFLPQLPPGGRIEIDEPLAAPEADPRLLHRVLANLIDNGLKYQPAGQAPCVGISAVAEGDEVVIRVADNGIGIAAEHREKIFDVFQRLHDERDYPGTGIGLAIARKAARLMGGSLTVTAESGAGSVFVLRLPAAGNG